MTTLLGLGVAWGAYRTFTTATPLKAALKDSGLYGSGVEAALEQSGKNQATSQDLPLNQPEVRKIVENAFSPQYTQSQAERVIDATYAWLKGDTANLSFSIDLTEAKTRLTEGVSSYVQKRLDTLPTCTSAAQLPADGKVDPYNATCIPPGTDKAAIIAQAQQQITDSDVFKDSSINAADATDGNGKTVANQLAAGPAIYNALVLSFYVAIASAVLFAAGVIFLSASRWRGVRNLGIMLLASGAASGVLSWLTDIGIRKMFDMYMQSAQGNQVLQEKVFKVVTLLIGDIRGYWLWYSAVVAALGVITLVMWHLMKPTAADVAQSLAGPMAAMKTADADISTGTAGESEYKNKPAKNPAAVKK